MATTQQRSNATMHGGAADEGGSSFGVGVQLQVSQRQQLNALCRSLEASEEERSSLVSRLDVFANQQVPESVPSAGSESVLVASVAWLLGCRFFSFSCMVCILAGAPARST